MCLKTVKMPSKDFNNDLLTTDRFDETRVFPFKLDYFSFAVKQSTLYHYYYYV